MTMLEHLLEVRSRITWSAAAVVAGMIVFLIPPFPLSDEPIGFAVIDLLKEPALKRNADFGTQAITPMENIVTFFRVTLVGGLALGMPVLIYQALRFVHPALEPAEKRWIYPIVFGATLAFALGMAFAYFLVLPATFAFLGTFGSSFADIEWTISSYIDLTTRLILVLGFVFETPIFVMGLAKFGVVSARGMLGAWRYAVVGAFAISAIVTPTPDPVVQSLVAGPMILLYFVGIGLAWFVRRD